MGSVRSASNGHQVVLGRVPQNLEMISKISSDLCRPDMRSHKRAWFLAHFWLQHLNFHT